MEMAERHYRHTNADTHTHTQFLPLKVISNECCGRLSAGTTQTNMSDSAETKAGSSEAFKHAVNQ